MPDTQSVLWAENRWGMGIPVLVGLVVDEGLLGDSQALDLDTVDGGRPGAAHHGADQEQRNRWGVRVEGKSHDWGKMAKGPPWRLRRFAAETPAYAGELNIVKKFRSLVPKEKVLEGKRPQGVA